MKRTVALSVALVGLAGRPSALAATPTGTDCVTASETSLRLGSEHKLRAERGMSCVFDLYIVDHRRAGLLPVQ
jgi:hypothetical protein